jgi:hypothetical protein
MERYSEGSMDSASMPMPAAISATTRDGDQFAGASNMIELARGYIIKHWTVPVINQVRLMLWVSEMVTKIDCGKFDTPDK